MKKPVCDKNCFNCRFPDCIHDGLDHEDYRQSSERDRILTRTPEQERAASRARAYRAAHREREMAQHRAYRQKKAALRKEAAQ